MGQKGTHNLQDEEAGETCKMGDLRSMNRLRGRHRDQSAGDCYVGDGQRNSGNCGAANSKGPSGRVKGLKVTQKVSKIKTKW